jgi:hypothetical protein
MNNFINEQTNKWIKKIQQNYQDKHSHLVTTTELTKPNIYFILPFVSLLSFLAGFTFNNLISNKLFLL